MSKLVNWHNAILRQMQFALKKSVSGWRLAVQIREEELCRRKLLPLSVN